MNHRRIIGDLGVPQIWLTYDELGALMNCDAAEARGTAAAIRLARRKSRDGQTRAKLSPFLAERFLNSLLQQRLEQQLADSAADLRSMHERMAGSAAEPQLRSAVGG